MPLHDLGRTIVLSGVFDTFGYTYLFYLNDAYVCAVLQACGSADTLESALALMWSCARVRLREHAFALILRVNVRINHSQSTHVRTSALALRRCRRAVLLALMRRRRRDDATLASERRSVGSTRVY